MQIISSLLFAISASLDNFTVSFAYGIKKVKISTLSNLVIALLSSLSTIIALEAGNFLISVISIKAANTIGGLILVALGFWYMLSTFIKAKINVLQCEELMEDPKIIDKDNSGTVDFKESISLALALMLNNIGLGLAASITNLNIVFTAIVTFLLSIFMIFAGHKLGEILPMGSLSKFSEYLSGIIIAALGIVQLLFG